jgi:hypothetical protein
VVLKDIVMVSMDYGGRITMEAESEVENLASVVCS